MLMLLMSNDDDDEHFKSTEKKLRVARQPEGNAISNYSAPVV